MFNAEQRDYVEYLAGVPPERRCWCGWFPLDKCESGCPPGRTAAEKLARRCGSCGNTPMTPDGPTGHYIGCARREVAG